MCHARKRPSSCASSMVLLALVFALAAVEQASECETPPVFRASGLLPADVLSGPSHRVAESVVNDGYMNRYVIQSDFGVFRARGHEMARLRVREVNAIAKLRAMKRSEACRRGAQGTVKGVVTSPFRKVKKIVANPLHIVTVVPGQVGEAVGVVSEVGKFVGSGLSKEYFHELVGYTRAKRQLARQLGVDPETHNPILQADLSEVAWSFYAGAAPLHLADKFLMPSLPIPKVGLVDGGDGSMADAVDMVEDQVKAKSTRKRLKRMGVAKPGRKAFGAHSAYTGRMRKALVEALFNVKHAENRGSFIQLAMQAPSHDFAFACQRTAEMMAACHERTAAISRVETRDGLVLCFTEDEALFMPAYCDYLAWTPEVAGKMRALPEAPSRELWVSGSVSPRAAAELSTLGIAITRNALEVLQPEDEKSGKHGKKAAKRKRNKARQPSTRGRIVDGSPVAP